MAKAKRKLPAGKLEVGPSTRDQAVLNAGGSRCESVLYDFSQDGGAVGTLSFGRLLPAGALVVRVFTDEQTAVTGADDIDLIAGSTDLVTAIDFTGDAGIQSRALAGSADGIKLSSDSELKIAINTNAATAGKNISKGTLGPPGSFTRVLLKR